MRDVILIWDLDDDPQGNVRHIAQHDVSKDEVHQVLADAKSIDATSRSTGEDVTFGYTRERRYLVVVWGHVDDDPLTVYPITTYEVPEPKQSKRAAKKRGRR